MNTEKSVNEKRQPAFKVAEVSNSNLSKHEKQLNYLAEILMQSENLSASVEILREFAGECYEDGAVDAQNEACREIQEHYVAAH